MVSLRRFFFSKRGLESITAVLMLLLMFAAMTGILAFFVSSNLAEQQKTNIDKERAQEQIAITQITLNSQHNITGITISNTGTIESKIRALYREENGVVTLLTDPSIYIPQGSSKTLNVTSLKIIATPNSMIFAATERGVTSQGANEIQQANENQEKFPDTSTLTIGPLRLSFNSLNWATSTQQGNIGTWQQKWTIPSKDYCAWRLNLTNVDDKNRTLTINQYSGFSINKVSAPQTATWFLQATQQIVAWNETKPITYVWDNPVSRSAATKPTSQQGVNNVYLTIFGNYSDGQEFSQTVPFQAITVT